MDTGDPDLISGPVPIFASAHSIPDVADVEKFKVGGELEAAITGFEDAKVTMTADDSKKALRDCCNARVYGTNKRKRKCVTFIILKANIYFLESMKKVTFRNPARHPEAIRGTVPGMVPVPGTTTKYCTNKH